MLKTIAEGIAACAAAGLWFAPDPATTSRATIGGMIANNSAGTRSVIYGKTIDYVLELTVVLSDGSVVRMCPLDDDELEEKCRRDDLEGDCYRIVRTLAGEHDAAVTSANRSVNTSFAVSRRSLAITWAGMSRQYTVVSLAIRQVSGNKLRLLRARV